MKFKNLKYTLGFVLTLGLLTPACEIEPIQNPNGPTVETLTNGANLVDLQLLASGLESVIRVDFEFYIWTVSMVGREYYDLRGTDPRYTGELLGAQGAALDNNGFLTTRTFSARYKAIRNAYLLETATQNSSAGLTDEGKNGFLGFAKTLRAYQLLLVLNHQYQNGCRLDTSDPDNLGGFVSYTEGLTGVMSLLDEAAAELDNATFAFTSTLVGNAQEMYEFNRAIAARVAMYQGDKAKMRQVLSESFLALGGDLGAGVYHQYGLGGNDIANPLYYVPNQAFYTVHPSWLNDAEAGDTRVAAKTNPLSAPVLLDGLTGDTQVQLYASNTASVPIIRNEELVLMWAEANIGTNNAEAVSAINFVRNAAGLPNYAGATDDTALTNEVLRQRRYSLFGEGHYWIDMRRFNRINQIPTDRAGDVVHPQFPRPILEG